MGYRKIIAGGELFVSCHKTYIKIIKYYFWLHSIVDKDNKKLGDQFNQLIVKDPVFVFGLVVMVMMDIKDSYLKQTMSKKYIF